MVKFLDCTQLNLFQVFLINLISTRNIRIVQISACDGKINDPIYRIVMRYKHRNHILLIEPQKKMLEDLKNNYSNHKKNLLSKNKLSEIDNDKFIESKLNSVLQYSSKDNRVILKSIRPGLYQISF